MITDGKPFDTNVFFSGGAGMFIQYYDVIKPVYLYAILKMIATQETFGLPINIISSLSVPSLIEWYVKRRFINPFQQLDYQHIIDPKQLNYFLQDYLDHDESLYRLSPGLNITKLMSVYTVQHMSFPVYVYTKEEEKYVKEDCKTIFPGVNTKYLYGDLKECIKKCSNNFTYIFSDIELVRESCEILIGTCSHVLLATEYRYNYRDHCKTFKYDLLELAKSHPFIRLGITKTIDPMKLFASIINTLHQGGQ